MALCVVLAAIFRFFFNQAFGMTCLLLKLDWGMSYNGKLCCLSCGSSQISCLCKYFMVLHVRRLLLWLFPWNDPVRVDMQSNEPAVVLRSDVGQLFNRARHLASTFLEFCNDLTCAFFRTILLLTLVGMFRMLFFATAIRGGRYNADNPVIGSRRLSAAVPWHLFLGLSGFSPGQQTSMADRRGRVRCRRQAIPMRIWLFYVLLFMLIQIVSCGTGRHDGLHPAGFRANRRAQKLSGSVINNRRACRNPGSPPTPPDPDPSESSDDDFWNTSTFYLKLWGIGLVQESLVVSFRQGVDVRMAAALIVPDSNVAHASPAGNFAPIRAAAVHDCFPLVWLTDWCHYANGSLLLVDCTLLGRDTFSIWYPHRFLTHALLAEELWFIFQDEGDIYVYSLLHSQEPSGEKTAYVATNALCIVLQRDTLMPFCHISWEQAFRSYNTWGLQTDTLQEPPPDIDGEYCHAQMSFEGQSTRRKFGAK